ncbi:MAG: glycerate kinase [Desulfobacteraceae bacterium]|nr:MAG: glycerate kinase [Desulfobacteraceae bacterium]
MNNRSDILSKLKKDAFAIFQAGLAAVEPEAAVYRYAKREGKRLLMGETSYDLSAYQHIYLIGAGKAASPMVSAMENLLGENLSGGVAVVKYGHILKPGKITIMEAGHPVPDENGLKGAELVMQIACRAGENDLVICLLSGGGSALLSLPAPGITLPDKQETVKILLGCGATIHEINSIRKHISGIKGGRLAEAAYPATFLSLILSDVVGDDLDVIASGPTVPDAGTYSDCLEIIDRYGISEKLPSAVFRHLQNGNAGLIPETPKPRLPVFRRTGNLIIGSNMEAILSAKRKAQELGYNILILSSMMEGETREAARFHSAIAKEIRKTGHPLPPPACILSGGETTVTVTGDGKGGRNQEFALAAALDISGYGNIVIFSAGTDGTDGPTDAAGAVADTTTVDRALKEKRTARDDLSNNDAYHFFQSIHDLVITGPTHTNVMDLRIMLVG